MDLIGMFSRVLNMSLTSSIIIALVILARFVLRKTPKVFSYALWAVVLFRLLCPVSIPSPVSLLGMLEAPKVEAQGAATAVVYLSSDAVNRTLQPNTRRMVDPPVTGEKGMAQAEDEKEGEAVLPPGSPSPMAVLSFVWAIGAAGLFLYGTGSDRRFRRKLKHACRLAGNIYLVDHMDTALVAGLISPKIYLPSDLPERQMGYIIAHEQCHIRRLDHVTRHLAFAALCVHWFNPLVWAAFLLSGKDMEMSCDEAVIRKLGGEIRAEYSASLLTLAMGQRIVGATPLAFGGGDTKGRIKNMAKWKKPKLWVSGLCLALCVSILVACGVNPESRDGETAGPVDAVQAETAEIVGTDYLQRCAEVLELVQGSEGYQIVTYWWNRGGNILNDTSMSSYWKHGDNWLYMSRIPQDGYLDGEKALDTIFASMKWNGEYLSNYDGWGLDENGCIDWNGNRGQDIQEPWLAGFQWDMEKIDVLSTEDTNDHYIIHLAVEDRYDYSEDIFTDSYMVDFVFDKAWNFLNAAQTLNFSDAELGEFGRTATMQIVSLDGSTVKADMESYRNGEKSTMTLVHSDVFAETTAQIGEDITSFSNGDGSASFHLTEAVPETVEAKALTAKPMDFTGLDAKKIALALFGADAAMYEQCGDELSKADLEKNLAIWEHYSEEENLRELFPDFDNQSIQDYLLNVKMDIAQYSQQAAQAAEDPYVPYDWNSHADGHVAAMVKDNGIPYTFSLGQASENGVHMETCIQAGIGSWLVSNSRVEVSHLCSQLTRTAEPTQAQVDAAAQKAQEMLDQMGMGEWVVTQAYATCGRYQSVPEYQIHVSAAQKLEGLEITSSGYDPDQWTFSTEANFSFAADGTLMNFTCWSPLETVKEETVVVLDMDTLLARGKSALASYPPIRTFGKSAEYTVDISDIHWGMSRLSSDAASGTYRYVPSLVFRGGIDFHGAEGETLFFLTEGFKDRLVLNAADGSALFWDLPE